MPKQLQNILIKFLQSLIELIFFMPIVLMLSIIYFFQSNHLIIAFLGLPLSYLAGIVLFSLIKSSNKAVFIICDLVITGAASLLIYKIDASFPFALFWAMTSISVFRGIHLASSSWLKQSPAVLFGFQLGVYFAANIVFIIIKIFTPYLNILTFFGFVSLLLFLLICNFDQLKLALFSGRKKSYIPSSLLKSNLTFLCLSYVLICVLSQLQQFHSFVRVFIKFVFGILYTALNFIASLISTSKVEVTNEKIDLPFKEPRKSHNPLINVIFDLLIMVIIIAAAVLVLYLLVKLAKKLYHWISGRIAAGKDSSENLGYTDEKENIVKHRQNYLSRFKGRLFSVNEKESRWRDLKSNRDRIRYLYKHTLKKMIKAGYNFKSTLTPCETARELEELYKEKDFDAPNLAVVYNKARYGTEEISDGDVEKARRDAGI